ncbi:right-handed parallel beta-helix repeat-containing protein [Solihabitans fulvus]|uniref:right-handed parallel beta-helix repeat-containing protein n=1 Tax=Solihabitans fulvus TaxID=1892852 RepID=UPI001CB76060|nr:right-handed parallel beta-helix repeat-containing protein [Solihabitans fulvus]
MLVLAAGVLAAGASATAVAAGAAGLTVYVSPTGSDSNSGAAPDQPVQTLQKARDLARGLNQSPAGDVTVSLADGTYQLSQPLSLDARDSGANGHRVVWTAAAGAHPVVSGGVGLTGWHQTDAGKHIWAAPAPAGLRTRQLYVNGARATRATGALPVTVTQTSTGYTASAATMAGWRNPGDIEFVYTGGLGAWTEPRCPVGSISGNTITMAQPCWNNSTRRVLRTDGSGRTYELVGRASITESPTAVENAYELLDQPGEWYLDSAKSTVYYIPRAGEDLATAKVVAPALETLVSGQGTASAPIHDISFNGLQFSDATWLSPSGPEGFSEIQATYRITGTTGYATQGLCQFKAGGTCPYGNWTKSPGNVSFNHDKGIAFTGDGFARLGGAGLDLGDGSQGDLVKGCVFTDISGNGLELGGVDVTMPTAAGDHTSGNQILDNHLYSLPVEFHGGVAIDVGYAEQTTIAHNQIDHTAYTGISIGWGGWPDKIKKPAEPNYSNNNTLANNLIFNHMSMLGDGGAIYTNGNTGGSLATGEHLVGNVVHDQKSNKGHALYTDNGAGNITLRGNAEYSNAANDWGSKHVDYTANNGNYDPLDLEGNYWETGPADYNQKAVTIKGNHVITGPSQIPASIIANAGLESAYTGILGWHPAS